MTRLIALVLAVSLLILGLSFEAGISAAIRESLDFVAWGSILTSVPATEAVQWMQGVGIGAEVPLAFGALALLMAVAGPTKRKSKPERRGKLRNSRGVKRAKDQDPSGEFEMHASESEGGASAAGAPTASDQPAIQAGPASMVDEAVLPPEGASEQSHDEPTVAKSALILRAAIVAISIAVLLAAKAASGDIGQGGPAGITEEND